MARPIYEITTEKKYGPNCGLVFVNHSLLEHVLFQHPPSETPESLRYAPFEPAGFGKRETLYQRIMSNHFFRVPQVTRINEIELNEGIMLQAFIPQISQFFDISRGNSARRIRTQDLFFETLYAPKAKQLMLQYASVVNFS